jgi:hypothetical protein
MNLEANIVGAIYRKVNVQLAYPHNDIVESL